MADQPENPPARSTADKERSRQQSRPVSGGKSSTQNKGTSTKTGPSKQTTTKSGADGSGATKQRSQAARAQQQRSGGGGGGGGKGGGGKGGGGGGKGGSPRGRGPTRRSPAPFIWGAVALVLVFVVIIVLVSVTGSSPSVTATPVLPAPASVVHDITTIPPSVYNTVGITTSVGQASAPTAVSGHPPLVFDGKPGVFYFGAEYCPYCAAERWAIISSLARFGTFSNLMVTKSSARDIYPNTNTFSFRNATYSSPYFNFQTVEHQTGIYSTALGDYTILQVPNAQQSKLISTFDSQGSYPFVNFGNKFTVTGASYLPSILQGLTWQQIASNLNDPTNPVTQTIVSVSNSFSAAVCATDGGKPASVCNSKGVQEAAKPMGAKY
jgi:thiol-disulfide isomerase/thioredoxin